MRRLFQIDRKTVCFIKFIIEAYDNMALITTIDPFAAIIELNIAPGCEHEIDRLFENLKHEVLIRPIVL